MPAIFGVYFMAIRFVSDLRDSRSNLARIYLRLRAKEKRVNGGKRYDANTRRPKPHAKVNTSES